VGRQIGRCMLVEVIGSGVAQESVKCSMTLHNMADNRKQRDSATCCASVQARLKQEQAKRDEEARERAEADRRRRREEREREERARRDRDRSVAGLSCRRQGKAGEDLSIRYYGISGVGCLPNV
jgi:hypothetical protein